MSETKTTKKMTINDSIDEYQRVSKQINELEKYRNTIQSKLILYMQDKGLTEIEGESHRLRLRENQREVLAKKSVPVEIWSRYSTRISYPQLYVSQLKRKI